MKPAEEKFALSFTKHEWLHLMALAAVGDAMVTNELVSAAGFVRTARLLKQLHPDTHDSVRAAMHAQAIMLQAV